MNRGRRLKPWLIAAAATVGAGWLCLGLLEQRGEAFVDSGRRVVGSLEDIAHALERRDLPGLQARLAERYSGSDLGLTVHRLVDEHAGVRVLRNEPSRTSADRHRALAEWQAYLSGFEHLEQVRLVLHRLDRWSGDELAALVHFELVGTPIGESQAAVDRAELHVSFERAGDSLSVVGASLIHGERVIGSAPQFEEIGESAGIAFRNAFYPGFLSQPLAFGMIRYGPGGITAADYDNDGFEDLFIPDGVASRLFRNLGDGTFADATAAAGLGGLAGVSVGLFADYDNDGHKDLFVSRTFEPNQLFRNRGDNTYEDVTARSGIGADCCTTVASWGDVDNDGDLDLYVGRYLDPRTHIPTTFYARNGEPNRLYRNNGDGTFEDITADAGVGDPGLCLGTAFGDYDNDGDLDLLVANDFGRKTLYRNDSVRGGAVRFEDVTVATATLAYGAGMSASFGDYDNDGWLDLYVAHIRSDHGWFAEPPTVGRLMATTLTQGVWPSDLPLYAEIFFQSGWKILQPFKDMASGNTLLRNQGASGRVPFEDTTWQAGANPPGWFWGSAFADFDNDGWLDLYSANGWVYGERGTDLELEFLDNVVGQPKEYKRGTFFDPERFGTRSWHGWEHNRHLRSNGPGADGRVTFREIGRAMGTDLLANSRGIAIADFWNRGVLDIAVAASTDHHALLRNRPVDNANWITVGLTGAGDALPDGTNRDAVGARALVRIGSSTQLREVVLGDGYGSQSLLRLHFGLGSATQVDELTVVWPRSGRRQVWVDLPANQIFRVTEGLGGGKQP